MNWTEAESHCKTGSIAGTYTGGRTTLAKAATVSDMYSIIKAAKNNREVQWVGGKINNYRRYVWRDGTSVETASYWKSSVGTGDCVTLSFETQVIEGIWRVVETLSKNNCSKPMGFFCEYQANTCPYPLQHPGFKVNSMMLYPNNTFVGSRALIQCRPGFYRESTGSSASSSSSVNMYNCTGNRDPTYNPALYIPSEVVSQIQVCHPISCGLPGFNVSNVEKQPTIPPGNSFEFNTTLAVNCSLGFVDYQDKNSIKSRMMCQQSKQDKKLGYWSPGNFKPCVEVRCNSTELFVQEPFLGKIVKAVNKRTQESYDGRFQRSDLNLYDNVVTIACNDGYFFDDRSPTKTIICSLKENSRTVGQWKGYQGSKLPLPKRCEEVSCRYQSVLVKDGQNIQKTFLIRHVDGQTERVDRHSGDDYKFKTTLQFWCFEKFESANRNSDQNVTCGPQGEWTPKLTACIQQTEELKLGQKKHFEPPPQDAPAAQSVGMIVIVILVLFFSFIIMLDLSTLTRDVKTLRGNLKHLRERIKYRKLT